MQERKKLLGFWSVWALAVGTMIGSGILLLPTALAPFGMLSYGGWIWAPPAPSRWCWSSAGWRGARSAMGGLTFMFRTRSAISPAF